MGVADQSAGIMMSSLLTYQMVTPIVKSVVMRNILLLIRDWVKVTTPQSCLFVPHQYVLAYCLQSDPV